MGGSWEDSQIRSQSKRDSKQGKLEKAGGLLEHSGPQERGVYTKPSWSPHSKVGPY
jgi:hypothetical protein